MFTSMKVNVTIYQHHNQTQGHGHMHEHGQCCSNRFGNCGGYSKIPSCHLIKVGEKWEENWEG